MTQEKEGITFECNECGTLLHTDTSNFDSALNMLRRERWHPVKVGGDWEHLCDNCSKDDTPGREAA